MQKLDKTIFWIALAVIAGMGLGNFLPSTALAMAPLSKYILQLIKVAAAPLVFLAVIEAILRYRVQGSDFVKLLVVTLVNAAMAISIGLLVANIFQPGQYLPLQNMAAPTALQKIDYLDLLAKQLPASIVQPFADNSIMPIVLLALMAGFAWRAVRLKQQQEQQLLMDKSEALLSIVRDISETILLWMVKLVPFAVFVAIAKVTADHGMLAFVGLFKFVGLCLLGMVLHLAITYSLWLVLWVRIRLKDFWFHALSPVLYAFGVNSSLVALPLTLKALDNLKVSRRASTLAACVGTNLNNDGIILYEGFALLAIAQASGVELSLGTQVFAAVYCLIAAMGVAGVPEAGVVALTLVLGGLGIPMEALALLLSVDWIIARARSFLNVSADMVGSLVIDAWIKRSKTVPPIS